MVGCPHVGAPVVACLQNPVRMPRQPEAGTRAAHDRRARDGWRFCAGRSPSPRTGRVALCLCAGRSPSPRTGRVALWRGQLTIGAMELREDRCASRRSKGVKRIGFLSFGHWTASPYSQARSASDALLQSIELAVAAEELGADGAYFRVHHFARQLASPFPLLAAIGARTSRIEIGTGVIDMRYENPLYMAEDAGAADLIAGGRLQLGISRGSPEQVIEGYRYFGYVPAEGSDDADMAREHTRGVPGRDRGRGLRRAQPASDVPEPAGPAARSSRTRPVCATRIWWGAGTRSDRRVDRRAGHEPDEFDAAQRGHRRAVPPAAGRADRAVPQGVGRCRSRARAAGVGEPQHLPDRRRRRTAPTSAARAARSDQVGNIDGVRCALRQDLRRRAGRARRAAGARTRRSPRPTRCC